MKVQLTCSCGRRQDVPIALAGQSTPCAACGKPLTVPALGIAVESGKRPPARRPAEASPFASLHGSAPARPTARRTSCGATALLLIVSGVLLTIGCGIAAWQFGLQAYLPDIHVFAEAPSQRAPLPQPSDSPAPAAPAAPVAMNPAETAASDPPANPPDAPPSEPPSNQNKPADPAAALPVKLPPEVEKKPAVPVVAPARPFQDGDTFLQDLLVTQKSRFLVQGIPIATLLQYRIISRYTVDKVQADGSLLVQQKIESAVLTQADDLTQGLLVGPVRQLPGTCFTLDVSPRGEVKRLAGAGGAPLGGPARVPGGLGVQMAALLDSDGWKELGQATFYQPEHPDKAERWTRPMTHRWGPLGAWAGQVTYAFPGKDKAAEVKVPYTLKLAYQAPKGPGVPGALPFQVVASKFQPPDAAGIVLFNTQMGRTVGAEERFRVRGALVLLLLGQKTPTEVEEEQLFQMRIMPAQ